MTRRKIEQLKNPCFARKTKLLTVMGACFASSAMTNEPRSVFTVAVYVFVGSMVMAGALVYFVFVNAVAGLFGQPAATEAAFAAACAFASAAEPPVPEETARLLKTAFCWVAALANSCRLCAESGT